MGVDRKKAKTLNFALLYGAGVDKLAAQLGISVNEARSLRDKYFKALPKITKFVNEVKDKAKNRSFYGSVPYIFNWAGRYLYFAPYMFEGELKQVNYKAPNHLIQSSGAEIMRKAMIRVHEYLADKRSKLVLSIHDEAIFEMHEEEMGLVKYIKQMMIDVYEPKNGLHMAVESSTGQNMGEL
jgi:DNA polymerase-1